MRVCVNFLFKIYFLLLFVCVCMYIHIVCQWPRMPRESVRSPRVVVTGFVILLTWMLGTKVVSSGRAENALNY